VQDTQGLAMAVIAGSATLGPVGVLDYIASSTVPLAPAAGDQEALIKGYAEGMAKLRADYWKEKKVAEDRWPETVALVALATSPAKAPQVWSIELRKEQPSVMLIKRSVYLQGTYDSAASVLFGFRTDVIDALGKELKVGDQPVGEDAIYEILRSVKVLSPIDKLSTGVMPIQDAVELAVFLATVQIQMERFLPGEPYCGGPIDVMVLKTAPNPGILWFPRMRGDGAKTRNHLKLRSWPRRWVVCRKPSRKTTKLSSRRWDARIGECGGRFRPSGASGRNRSWHWRPMTERTLGSSFLSAR
jgi:hypothetical protein